MEEARARAARQHPADLQLRAQRSAARVMGKAEQLLAATEAVLAIRERELLDLAGPCPDAELGCRLHFGHKMPCQIREVQP